MLTLGELARRCNVSTSLRKLVRRLNCNLASKEWEQVFSDLSGEHFHISRDDDEYSL